MIQFYVVIKKLSNSSQLEGGILQNVNGLVKGRSRKEFEDEIHSKFTSFTLFTKRTDSANKSSLLVVFSNT